MLRLDRLNCYTMERLVEIHNDYVEEYDDLYFLIMELDRSGSATKRARAVSLAEEWHEIREVINTLRGEMDQRINGTRW